MPWRLDRNAQTGLTVAQEKTLRALHSRLRLTQSWAAPSQPLGAPPAGTNLPAVYLDAVGSWADACARLGTDQEALAHYFDTSS